MAVADADGERRRPLRQPLAVGDAVQADSRDREQPLEHARFQLLLVCLDRPHGAMQGCRTFRAAGAVVIGREGLPQPLQVLKRADHAGHGLVALRAGFELARQARVGRADFVGGQGFEQFAAPVQRPDVRGEELIRGAGQEVAAQVLNVDRPVRGVVHGVDERQRAGGFGHADDVLDRVDGADRVGGISEGDQFRSRAQVAFVVVEVQRAVRLADVHDAHGRAAILRHQVPGRIIGVVVQAGQKDFVARLERLADRAAEGEGQAGHVLAEDDFLAAPGVEEVGHDVVCFRDDPVAFDAGDECAAVIGVAAGQVIGHCVDARLRHLRAAGAVEIHQRPAVVGA